jgi:hypothetical protein
MLIKSVLTMRTITMNVFTDPFDKIESLVKPVTSKMEKVYYAPKVLAKYEGGVLFREVVSAFLKLSALLTFGVGVKVIWELLTAGSGGILGNLLLVAVVITFSYSTMHVLWIRASDIRDQPSSEIAIMPIAITLIRMCGEIASLAFFVFGIIGAVIALLGSQSHGLGPFGFITEAIDTGSGLGAALGVLVQGGILGFASAFFSYLTAELLNLTVSMAKNMEKLASK